MNRPWMPLYIADYRADTAHLGAAEHGGYLLLIMHYWQTGGLPNEDRQLARIACMSNAEWKKARATIASFFTDNWKHKRIDAEIAHAEDVSNKRRTSAEQRYSKSSANASAIAPASAELKETHARCDISSLPGLPSSATTYEKQAKNGVCFSSEAWPRDFREQFWACYPRKVDKAAAMRKLERIRRDGKVEFARLLAAVQKYAADADPEYTKHPDTWLNKGCWDDEPAEVKSNGSRPPQSDKSVTAAALRSMQRRMAGRANGADILSLSARRLPEPGSVSGTSENEPEKLPNRDRGAHN